MKILLRLQKEINLNTIKKNPPLKAYPKDIHMIEEVGLAGKIGQEKKAVEKGMLEILKMNLIKTSIWKKTKKKKNKIKKLKKNQKSHSHWLLKNIIKLKESKLMKAMFLKKWLRKVKSTPNG